MTDASRISQIQPKGATIGIDIRVIRKWKPYHHQDDRCYLLIDKYGDTIQAFFSSADEEHLAALINLMDCYRINSYVCKNEPTFLRLALHQASIRIGTATSIEPIAENANIPCYYFNFVPHDLLKPRGNHHELLTGRVEQINDIDTESNNNLMQLTLLDTHETTIVVALWPEIASTVDKNALRNAKQNVAIAAITSLKVTQFKEGQIRLTSTTTSQVHINPDIDSAKSMAASFSAIQDVTESRQMQ